MTEEEQPHEFGPPDAVLVPIELLNRIAYVLWDAGDELQQVGIEMLGKEADELATELGMWLPKQEEPSP